MLRRLLRGVRWPPLVATFTFAMLATGVWFGVNRIPGLSTEQRETVRLIGLSLLGFVWLGTMFWFLFQWLRRAWKARQSDPDPLAARRQSLEETLATALDVAGRLRRPSGGRRRSIHLLIGPEGAGKSSLLERSNLPVDKLDPVRSVFSAEGPTQDLDCVLCEDAIILDTTGAFTTASDAREIWLHFLDCVRRRAGVASLGTVIGVVPATALLDTSGQVAERLARQLSRQIEDVQAKIGGVPEITLVINHCDQVPGFLSAFDQGASADAALDVALTATVPPIAGQGARALTLGALQHLQRRFVEAGNARMVRGAPKGELSQLLQLPGAIESLMERTADFVAAMVPSDGVRSDGWLSPIRLWFTAAPAPNQTVAASQDRALAAFRLPPYKEIHSLQARVCGVAALFRSLPMFTGGERRLTKSEHRRQQRLALNGLLSAVALVLAGGLLIFTFVLANDIYQDGVLQTATAAVGDGEQVAPHTLLLLGAVKPVEMYGLAQGSLGLTDAAMSAGEDMPRRWSPPWLSDSREALRPSAEAVALARTEVLLLDPIERSLTEDLIQLAAEIPPGTPPSTIPCEWKSRARAALRTERLWRGVLEASGTEEEEEELLPLQGALEGDLIALSKRLSDEAQVQSVHAALLAHWVTEPNAERLRSEGFADLRAAADDVRARLGEDGIASMILELVVPTEDAGGHNLRSGLFTASQVGWPAGYTGKGCRLVSAALRSAERSGSLSPTPGREACGMSELTSIELNDARELYTERHGAAWRDMLRRVRTVDDATLHAATDEKLGEWARLAFMPETGDLDVLLLAMGRGLPLLESPPEDAPEEELEDASWCSCLASRFGLAHDLASPEGQLRSEATESFGAQVALAEAILKGTKDQAWWASIGRATFAGGGELFDANSASNLLSSTLSAPPQPRFEDVQGCEVARETATVDDLLLSSTVAVQRAAWDRALRSLAAELQAAWKQDVHAVWTKLKLGRPISAGGGRNVEVSQLQELLGEGGGLQSFLDEHLFPLMTPAEDVKRPLGNAFTPLRLTALTERMLQRRLEYQQLVAGLGDSFSVVLGTRDPQPGDVTQTAVELSGAPVLTWTSARGAETSTVSVAFSSELLVMGHEGPYRDRSCLSQSFEGPWALLDFLHAGGLTRWPPAREKDAQGYYPLRFVEKCAVNWRYKETGRGPLQVASELRSVELPVSLFEPVMASP